MQGQIVAFDAATGRGEIAADDGRRHAFAAADMRGATPVVGLRVQFEPAGDVAVAIYAADPTPSPAAWSGPATPRPTSNDWGSLFFSAEGRIKRGRFWMAWAILLGVGIFIGWIPVVGTLISLALIWPNIAIQTKRLHDMGRTGWWQLVPAGVALAAILAVVWAIVAAGGFKGSSASPPEAALMTLGAAFLIYFVVAVGFLIWIGATPGQPETNRFGPPPDRPDMDQVFA